MKRFLFAFFVGLMAGLALSGSFGNTGAVFFIGLMKSSERQ